MLQKTQSKLSKHDRYVQELCKIVRPKYDYLILDYLIGKNKRMLGQVDVCGVKDGKTDLFEVKCSNRRHKAFKQLIRAKRLAKSDGKLYFYCGSSKEILEVEE